MPTVAMRINAQSDNCKRGALVGMGVAALALCVGMLFAPWRQFKVDNVKIDFSPARITAHAYGLTERYWTTDDEFCGDHIDGDSTDFCTKLLASLALCLLAIVFEVIVSILSCVTFCTASACVARCSGILHLVPVLFIGAAMGVFFTAKGTFTTTETHTDRPVAGIAVPFLAAVVALVGMILGCVIRPDSASTVAYMNVPGVTRNSAQSWQMEPMHMQAQMPMTGVPPPRTTGNPTPFTSGYAFGGSSQA